MEKDFPLTALFLDGGGFGWFCGLRLYLSSILLLPHFALKVLQFETTRVAFTFLQVVTLEITALSPLKEAAYWSVKFETVTLR